MSFEMPTRTRKETIPPPEITGIHTPEELERYFAFANPVIGVDWGEGGVLEEYTPVYVAAHPELTQVFVAKDGTGEIIAGAKVTILNDGEKNRLGLAHGSFENQQGALLEYAAVKEEHRSAGMLGDLTEQRIAWAREHGAAFVCSEAEITNPISIYTKIRDGFVLASVQPPSEGVVHPYFVETKSLNPKGDEKTSATPALEWKEVTVTEGSFDELKALFSDGWIGIDIKGADESPERLTVPWTLILERQN
jgi:hypothetical protein